MIDKWEFYIIEAKRVLWRENGNGDHYDEVEIKKKLRNEAKMRNLVFKQIKGECKWAAVDKVTKEIVGDVKSIKEHIKDLKLGRLTF